MSVTLAGILPPVAVAFDRAATPGSAAQQGVTGSVPVSATPLGITNSVPVAAAPRPSPSTPVRPTSGTCTDQPDPVGGGRLGQPGLLVDAAPGTPPPPVFPTPSFLLADLDTGDVLLAQCPHSRGLPASTIKALTAITVRPRLQLDRVVVATEEDAAVEGTKVGLVPGQSYTVEQLLAALLMASGNDAATALARANGGMQPTAAQMTEQARHLGAFDTAAANTSGLDAPGQTTSAYDLALIGRQLLRDDVLRQQVQTPRRSFPGQRIRGKKGARAQYELANHNALLANVAGTIGVKNGYTVAARHTLIAANRRGSRGLVLTYLGMDGRDWRQSEALLNWGYAQRDRLQPIGHLVEPGTVEAPAGAAPAPLPGVAAGGPATAGNLAPASGSSDSAPADPGPATSAAATSATRDQSLVRWAGTALVLLLAAGVSWSARRCPRARREPTVGRRT